MSDLPSTPRCFEWANGVRAQFMLLEDFRDWWSEHATTYEDGGYPLPGQKDFERYLEWATGFSFAELERERRALLEYQRSLNEKR